MKNNFITKFLFLIAFTALVAMPNDANAWLFFGSEKKDLLNQANETYELAIKANNEGRSNDAIILFSDARGQYSSILNTYPEFETAHVTERLNSCGLQMKIIRDKIVSGEISLPASGDTLAKKEESPATQSIDIQEEPNTKEPTIVDKSNVIEEEKEEQITSSISANSSYSSNNPLANSSEANRIILINSMLDSNKATDAIFYIDEIIDAEGDNTPLSIRCLYVKALISVGNKTMAKAQLDILKSMAPKDPSVRTLSAALAVANGDAMDAMLQLDKLIEENPKYAEARINFAYLLLMMDPTAHRNAAIDSYKLALKLGAKRDPNLEKNLNIVVK